MKRPRKSPPRSQVLQAIARGDLVRLEDCELCDCHKSQSPIVGHHWRGYEYPLDVWWICQRCNRMLEGKHDGNLTKEQAREFIRTSGVTETMSELLAQANQLKQIGAQFPRQRRHRIF